MSLILAIVGRPNVGKSSLFNRLVGDRVAITDDEMGTTRDRIYGKTEYKGHDLSLIDTGGLVFDDGDFHQEIRTQVNVAIDEANLILFVCDGQTGLNDLDYYVGKVLRNSKKKVIIVVNKVDNIELTFEMYDFYKLGYEDVICVSTIHQIGIYDLLDEVVKYDETKDKDKDKDQSIKFAILGRPNVGKSSIINSIINKQRVIVSPISGTTTDSIDIDFTFNKQLFTISDTAGIRQKSKLSKQIEKYSYLRTMIALDKCDVAVLVLDANEEITALDKQVCSSIMDSNKALTILINKTDLIDQFSKEEYIKNFRSKVEDEFFVTQYAKVMFISALHDTKVGQIIKYILECYQNYTKEISTSTLNTVLNEIVLANPPTIFNSGIAKFLYITQVGVKPPTFSLFVNDEEYVHFTYKRYIINQLRKYFDYTGTPIIINIITRSNNELK